MRVAGVICEYNPFHRGHEWMLRELRAQGMDAIVCAMSGNTVQRGEVGVADKFARAEMAVRCGADLVLELPSPWASATAETFARGGVSLLQQTGVVTHLAFGSECGDAAALRKLAAVLDSEEYHAAVRRHLSGGESFAVCRQKAAAVLVGEETAALLASPNNNLAVEYCRALSALESTMEPITVRRIGAGHDGGVEGGIASASYLRELLFMGREEEAMHLMSDAAAAVLRRELSAGRAPASLKVCERAVLGKLRAMAEEDFRQYDGGGEGLYHRLYQAVRSCAGIEELVDSAKTKRYSHARLRRMLLSAWLDIPQVQKESRIPYLRVLAANERGRALLRQMRDGGAPVLTKPADVGALGQEAETLFADESRRADLCALACPNLRQSVCGQDWRRSPVMVKEE